jgi:hypothetical protein
VAEDVPGVVVEVAQEVVVLAVDHAVVVAVIDHQNVAWTEDVFKIAIRVL